MSIARRTRSSRCRMAVLWKDAARSALVDSGKAALRCRTFRRNDLIKTGVQESNSRQRSECMNLIQRERGIPPSPISKSVHAGYIQDQRRRSRRRQHDVLGQNFALLPLPRSSTESRDTERAQPVVYSKGSLSLFAGVFQAAVTYVALIGDGIGDRVYSNRRGR